MFVRSGYRESINRPTTQQERDVIRWLLEHGTTGSEQFVPQIDDLIVVGKCTCGCPTIDFAYEGNPVLERCAHLLSDNLGMVDDETVGVMLFQKDGRLSILEVYSMAGTDKPFRLPDPKNLYLWEEYSRISTRDPQVT